MVDLLALVFVRDFIVDESPSLTASAVSRICQEHPRLAITREFTDCSYDCAKAVYRKAVGARVRVLIPTPKGATSRSSS